MKRALDSSVPDELFELYNEVITSINGKSNDAPQTAQRILSWIYYARRTLKMTELREAIAIGPGDVEPDEEDWMDPDDIVELCESLVIHDAASDTVRFSHEQVQIFLQTRSESYLLPETDIASACLNFLFLDVLREGPAGDESVFRNRVQQHPFCVYAARYWAAHLRDADAELNDEVCSLLIQVCQCQAKVDAVFQMEKAEKLLANWAFGKTQWLPGGSLLHLCAGTGLARLCSWTLENAEKIWVTNTEITAEEQEKDDDRIKNSVQSLASGSTPLAFASFEGHASVSEILISAGADINAQSATGQTPMILASGWGHIEVVKRLLKAEASTEIKNNDGFTALHSASHYGRSSVVQLLLDSGAKVDSCDHKGRTPLFSAVEGGHLGVFDILLNGHADPRLRDETGYASLPVAALNGHVNIVRRFLEIGVEVDFPCVFNDGSVLTALFSAALNGHLDIVKLLLDAGANVELQNELNKWTALHAASTSGHLNVVKRLLEAKANVEALSVAGSTPLGLAAGQGHVLIVKELLEAKANVQGSGNWTPLHMAANNGHHDVVSCVLDAGAEIDALNTGGYTALHLASKRNHVETVKMLLERTEDSKIPGEGGNTALHMAVQMGHVDVVKLLVNASTITMKNGQGQTALHEAAAKGLNIFVAILSAAATKLSILDSWSWAVLFSVSAQIVTGAGRDSFHLVAPVHNLFATNRLPRWKWFASLQNDNINEELDISTEEEDLEQILSWLGSRNWEDEHWKSSQLEYVIQRPEFEESGKWYHAMETLEKDDKFGEYIGKVATCLWATGETANHDDLRTIFRLALKYYWKRNDRAKSTFEELRELLETQFEALMEWAGIYSQRPSMPSDLSLGAAYFAIRKWDQAVACYKCAIQASDSNIELWQLVSSAYRMKGKLDGASEFFERMVEKFKTDISARYLLAGAYEEMGNFDKAITVYEAIIEMKQEVRAWLGLAGVYHRRGDYEGEVKAYKLAFDKAPTEMQSSLSLRMGKALVLSKDFDEAIVTYKMLLQKEPDQSTVRHALASVYQLKGLDNEAITVYETWLEENPKNGEAWTGLIDLYKTQKDFERAIKAFQDWHRIDPANELPIHGLGQLYHSMGHFNKAVECYESVQEPKWTVNAWKYFGRSYVALKEYNKAIKLYRSVLQKMPDQLLLWLDLVEVYKLMGDEEGASAELGKVTVSLQKRLGKNPTRTEVLDDLGLIYYAKGAYDKAIKMYQAALEAEPSSIRWLRIGHCYRAKGELSQAIKVYERLCMEHNPENRCVSKVADLKQYFLSCDGCGACPLRGLWHKCLICFDYDLCDGCRKQNPALHSNHEFFTIPSLSLLSQMRLEIENVAWYDKTLMNYVNNRILHFMNKSKCKLITDYY